MKLQKTLPVFFFLLVFLIFPLVAGTAGPEEAEGKITRYEYKLVPLGSLTALQNEGKSAAKMKEIGKALDREGREGWEMVNIFAVRTTFDPNVFFVAMKRPLSEPEGKETKISTKGDEQP
ncbi:MAG: DUF4177 domain-containing protein [Synergistaceae bacterium]|jgi:hypothetical protein|nr:DUF4177 domain-containing protein [Synergistaceae bacterium]